MSPGTSPCLGVGVAILVAACDQAPSQLVGDAPDATQAAVDATLCYGSGIVTACLSAAPSQPLALSFGTTSLDTSNVSNCTQVIPQPRSGPEVCVIAATTITVTSTVIATGSRPLVLIGTDTVTISGTIDVSSASSPQRTGAGGSQGPCSNPGPVASDDAGAGGGAGGSLGTKGGNGGTGDQTMKGSSHTVAEGGTAGDTQAMPGFLRGGCRGENGGTVGLVLGGAGGDGGGAVYIIAGNKITITGDVFASGAGGGGGGSSALPVGAPGGGGGGSGGLIGLEAPAIEIASTSRLVANGGGGGGGSGPSTGGSTGGDGTTTAWDTPAPGGAPGFDFEFQGVLGPGAPGSAGQGDGMSGSPSDSGGGGGGGGLGLLWVDGVMTGGATMLSPPPTSALPQ